MGTAESNNRARLADGRELSHHIDMGAPESDLEKQGRRVEQKFLALASPIVGEKKARRLFESLLDLEQEANVGKIAAAL